MTAELVAAGDANETTPSDTPLRKLLARQSFQTTDDREALRRIMTMAEGLIRERRSLRSTAIRMFLESFAAGIFAVGILVLFWIDEAIRSEIIPALGATTLSIAFLGARLFSLRALAADYLKNERLTGRAVEFVREYAALTRADRGPAEEAEFQLRLDQIGIEPLDRPM